MARTGTATNAGRLRQHNERAILAELRRLGSASKPEIARRVALTRQAVNVIFERMLEADLICEGGKRVGSVGHPSTLYSISPTGAYTIGIDVQDTGLEFALVNFSGRMVYRALTGVARRDAAALRTALAGGFEAIVAHARKAGLDIERIVGIGVAEPLSAAPGLSDWRAAVADAARTHGLDRPVHVQDRATVSALAMAIMQEETLPASYLYIALGEEIGACLVLDGEPRLAQRGEAGRFGAALVREAGSGEMRPLDRLAGYAALRATLAADGFEATDEDALYRAVHERAGLVESWSRAAGEALFLAVQPLHAGLGLGAVILCTAPPKSIGDRIFDSFRAGFAEAAKTSAAAPALRRDEPPTGAQAMRAAGLALYERFSPRLRGLTRRDEDATAEDEA